VAPEKSAVAKPRCVFLSKIYTPSPLPNSANNEFKGDKRD